MDFTQTNPRKVTNITILRGARARGVKVGDRIRDIKDAYPKAKVNKQTEDVFGVWLVRVPRNGGGRITFSVPVDTKRIDRISNLLGSDWQEPDVALNLQLAVRLHGLAQRVGALAPGHPT